MKLYSRKETDPLSHSVRVICRYACARYHVWVRPQLCTPYAKIDHGNRSEKIRTYNQPQDRVTDHRVGFNSTYNGVLLGDQLGTVIEALAAAVRAEKLPEAVD